MALTCAIVSLCFTRFAGAQSVPSPWTATDIGSPALAGSATASGNVFTIDAGGVDIWGTADQFHFVYQPISGDVDVRARVDSVSYASSWSKAGVMIRSSLAAGAAHGFALVSAGKGTAFQRRTTASGDSTHTAGPFVTAPQWVRLVRSGTTLTAYSSADGATWTTIGSDTVQLGTTAYVGIAVTSHIASALTTASLSSVATQQATQSTQSTLPAGQAARDIGSPAIKGTTSYGAGRYTISGAGADIWGTSDQFQYVYQQASGDVDVKVRVASITYADKWSKAGVMIRQSLSADAAHGYALASAGRGYAFQRRPAAGDISVSTAGSTGAPPGWLRLKRTGNLLTAYQSVDGSTWTTIGSDTIVMADPVYVGIAVTSHNASAATTVVADNFAVTSVQAPNNQLPTVSLTASGAPYTAPATVSLAASASDPENQMGRVEFYNGSSLLGTDTTAPYSMTWSSVAAGTYSLTAIAYDAAGQSAQSVPVSITVAAAANQPPTVSLTAPANGASFVAPASITISASASDPENQLTRVDFYNGSTLLGSDTSAPYAFTWSNVAAGTYSLSAIARDVAGLTKQSAVVSVTVGAATQLPSGQQAADIGSPAIAGSTTYSGGTYQIRAGGTDIWDSSDQFHFVYQPVTGDTDVRVRVDSMTFSASWAKAGVMIRNTLAAGSIHAYAAISFDQGVVFNRRLVANGSSLADSGSMRVAPGWVRLTRSGDLFTAYESGDGQTWTLIASRTITMASTVYVGIAVTSQNPTTPTTVAASALSITQGTPANQPPSVSLTAPANGATFPAPASITISATASDPENQLTRVDFYNGSTLLGSDTSAPYSFTWSNVAAGTYSLTAMARDAAGLTKQSAAVGVTVTASTGPPTGVTFQASADHATVTSYKVEVFATGVNTTTGTSLSSIDVGKPTPNSSNDITVSISSFFSALAPGNYQLTVAALNGAQFTRSTPVAFTR